jgi:FtsZ-binding cell division protein ZapB
MISLEQVKLLETKVAKAIDYVNHLTGENTMLKEKLAGYQTRIDELEVLIKQFKEDQGRIEGGILSALDRLNQFEDAIEKGVSGIIPKEDKIILPVSAPVKDTSIAPSIEEPAEDNALFSEISPALDSDVASSDDDAAIASEEATIMAALEEEEQAAKAKASQDENSSGDALPEDAASPGDASPEAELDIF